MTLLMSVVFVSPVWVAQAGVTAHGQARGCTGGACVRLPCWAWLTWTCTANSAFFEKVLKNRYTTATVPQSRPGTPQLPRIFLPAFFGIAVQAVRFPQRPCPACLSCARRGCAWVVLGRAYGTLAYRVTYCIAVSFSWTELV